MTQTPSSIAGVLLTPLRIISDPRGTVKHMLRADAPHFIAFGEIYFSTVLPGAVKAWKRHRRMTLNLAAPVGAVRLVLFDDRPDSPSRSRIEEIELDGADHYQLATVPPLVWSGFIGLGPEPAVVANCATQVHCPAESDQLAPDDPQIPYCWITGPLRGR